jgi:hypothetical protein
MKKGNRTELEFKDDGKVYLSYLSPYDANTRVWIHIDITSLVADIVEFAKGRKAKK